MALAEAALRSRLLPWPRVVLFGDSITEFSFQDNGWGVLLAQKLVRKCDVLNRGLSGYNTRWANIVLPRLISKSSDAENTVAVTIFFGANDSALKDVNPNQHIPLDEYAGNLKRMVQYLKSIDITEDRIILITPPPLCESAWEKECIAKGKRNSISFGIKISKKLSVYVSKLLTSKLTKDLLCLCAKLHVYSLSHWKEAAGGSAEHLWNIQVDNDS